MQSKYKIDPSTIDEGLFMKKSRQQWVNERFHLQSLLLQQTDKSHSDDVSRNISLFFIREIQEKIDYIDEVLERWYSDMCIKCGKLTMVDTYCGQPERCKHCFENFMRHYLSDKTEEELDAILERIKQLKGD